VINASLSHLYFNLTGNTGAPQNAMRTQHALLNTLGILEEIPMVAESFSWKKEVIFPSAKEETPKNLHLRKKWLKRSDDGSDSSRVLCLKLKKKTFFKHVKL